MGIYDLASNLLFPPKCAACGRLLDAEITKRAYDPLCAICRKAFEREKMRECNICGLSAHFCRCMPKNMSRAQCTALLKVVPYRPESATGISGFVCGIKSKRNERVFRFFAEQMRAVLIDYMRAESLTTDDCVITYMPRSEINVVEQGFDQGLLLARSLSYITGIRLVPCFIRINPYSVSQKELSETERRLNMTQTFEYITEARSEIEGRTVIIVDDIVTTGSSMASCARLASALGAFDVIGICVGRTEIRKKS